jgi:predicted Zn finger-like uncharacterized protein
MRIVCQKCSAAYAIDDKFVTPKGVRAQCPRCRHLQLVKKDDAPAAAAPGAPSPFLFDMGAPPPPPAAPPPAPPPSSSGSGLHFGQTAPSGGQAAPSPFDFSAPAPGAPTPFDFSAPPTSPSNPAVPSALQAPAFPGKPPPPPPAASEPSPFDFSGVGGGANPFDFGSPPPGPPAREPDPFGGELDLGAPLPPPPSGKPLPPPPPPAPAASPQVSGVKCRTCGKEMNDPFDQALGVCDDCRNKAAEPVAPPPPMAAPPPAAERSASKAPSFPSAHTPITTAADMRGGVQSAMRDAGGGGEGRGKVIGLVIGLLVLIGLAVGVVIKKPWATKPPPLVVKGNTGATRPVEQIVQQWRNKYLDLEKGAGPQLIDEGEAQLLKDTTSAYRDAEESFEQALVLDPGSDRALAGWVLALAFGKPGKIDDPTANAAESMLTAAEQRGGDARIFVAHAHFLIARGGNPNDIKVLAERGLSAKSNAEKALAHLAIGQTILHKSPEQAAENFKEALAIDPKLKRAYFFQAQLSAIQGNYKEATRALERRLELDADQWEAAEELARLLLDVGEVQRAKKVLEAAKTAAPKSGRPRIGLAVLAYQHLNDLNGAATELTAVVDDAEVARGEKADALLHLATIQRVQGDADKASDTIARSLELNAESVPAKLQKLLILIDKGVASAARLELDGLKGKLGDKYLEATLEGRVLMLETRLDEAIQTLGAAAEADPRRVDATLLAGAAAARARKSGKAWEFCLKRGLRSDPSSRPVPSLTPLYVRPADLLKAAVGAYAALVPNADEDPSPALCEGLVAWFSEDYATADKHFSRVTAIDPRNPEGFAFRSLVASRRRDVGGAQRFAARAVEGGKGNALAWYAQATALAAANKTDNAKTSAQQAQKFGPQLLGPKVIVGDAEATQKNAPEAKRLLTSVLLADPLYRDAKRVLFKHQL